MREQFPGMVIGIADQKEKLVEDTNLVTHFGSDYLKHLSDYQIIIKSPGISGIKREILEVQKKGVEITSQTKIFFDVCRGVIIGVTGTKGKTTTCSLIYEMLKKANLAVDLVGNIGNPVLDSLVNDSKAKYYVFELSSHQLFDLEKSPHFAAVTNVAVDHLDWYGNFENYVDAKTHILKYQTKEDVAVLNYDNLITREFDRFTKGKVFFTSKEIQSKGSYVENGIMYLKDANTVEKLGNVKELKLIGKHNWDNVMLAAVIAKQAGLNNDTIWQAACGFKQLEHHLEFVKEVDGVAFYDDSFAVDQIATSAAINSFTQKLILILGGFDRGIDYSQITSEIAKKENIKSIVVIGQIADKLTKTLKKAGYTGKIINLGKVSMEKIVKTAVKDATSGDIVLLSPAAASFDMFKDYKDRGEQFKKAVNSL